MTWRDVEDPRGRQERAEGTGELKQAAGVMSKPKKRAPVKKKTTKK